MALAPIKVYPRIAEALVIVQFRRDRPALTLDGALWPADSFTHCRLADKSVTDIEALRYVPPVEAAAEPALAPAPADEHPAH